jgi:hypothetical protein
MDRAPGVLIDKPRVLRPVSAPVPRLRLLIEWEPRRRVFFENLKDLLFSRQLPPLGLTSRPARFWNDVFVPTGSPWTSFMEAMLWQVLLVVLLVWGQSRVWTPVKTFQDRDSYHQSITYYPPTESFRAAESRAANVKPHGRVRHEAAQKMARQTPLSVPPEQKPSIVTPPDIKEATARMPDLPASHPVAPMAPFSSAVGPRRNNLSGPSVAPPTPQVDQAKLDPSAANRLALPQPPAVAPAPNLGLAAARSMSLPPPAGQHVVPPPPSIQSEGNARKSGRLNSLSGRGPDIVPPSPAVQVTGDSARARLGSTANGESQVVAPPPSLHGAAAASNTGRYSSLSAGGPNVVPPLPSVRGASNSRSSRLGTLADGTSQVVTPAPSVQGTADSIRTGRSNSLVGGGTSVVPPTPSVSGFGDGARDARAGTKSGIGSQVVPPPASVQGAQGAASMVRSLSGAGSEVVPPPPSVEGGGNAGTMARAGSLSGDGSAIAPPPHPLQAAINSGPTGPLQPMEPLPAVAAQSAPPAPVEDKATVEELPLGFLGLVLAAPGTSYFSNFEVFVAKRRVAKGQLQLIKLVYQFLPYQKRLSEFDLNNLPPRVIKLRVIPDPSCNESLGEIIQPSPDPARPVTEYPRLPAVLRSADVNQILPCYRTTADDFEKAMLGGR